MLSSLSSSYRNLEGETWRAKLGGRNLEGETWRAQQAAPLQCAIYAAKPRGSKLLRCGAQTPSFDLRRKRSESNGERSYLVPAKAATWRFAPRRRSLLPCFFGSRSFGSRSFTGNELRSPTQHQLLQAETWRAQQAVPLQCAIYAAQPKSTVILIV